MYLYNDDDNDYSDEDDDYLDLPDDILEEIEYDLKIKIVNTFKNYIKNDAEFIGIKNISSSKILTIIEKRLFNVNKNPIINLTYNQIDLFNNLYKELFNHTYDINTYNNVTENILNIIYV